MKTDCALRCKQKNTDNDLALNRVAILTEKNYCMCHMTCGYTDIDNF
jgi:hypothetical protein